MRSYEEMAMRVLQRRDDYVKQTKIRNKQIGTAVFSLCLIAAVGLLGQRTFGKSILQGNTESTMPPLPSQTVSTPHLTVSTPTDTQTEDILLFNHIDRIPNAERMVSTICLHLEDYLPLEDPMEYFGTHVIPTVPQDMKKSADERFGIYRRNGGMGEVYWDQSIISYYNEDFTRSVHIVVRKGGLPQSDVAFMMDLPERGKTSRINGQEVFIGECDGCSYASFVYRNVGFGITMGGLSEDEIHTVLASLLAA